MFDSPFSSSILKRAIDHKLASINTYNIRDYTHDNHHTVDDYTYGGGAGMVLKPQPIFEAVESIKKQAPDTLPVILLTPQGRLFSQHTVLNWAKIEAPLLVSLGNFLHFLLLLEIFWEDIVTFCW